MPQPNINNFASDMAAADPLLPVLRTDVEFICGPPAVDGSGTWLIHDPLKGSFDKVSWDQFEILKRLVTPRHLAELVAEIREQTTLELGAEELALFVQGIVASGLTRATAFGEPKKLLQQAEAGKTTLLNKVFHHYLYFRIPLFHPARFLQNTVRYVRPLVSAPAFWLYALVLLLGLLVLTQKAAEYVHTFTYFFNFRGMLWYSSALILLKVVHEFSHAYVSTGLGCRVRTMGVAFMVLWPVAFCDVTDSWRLASRRQRLGISAAGMASEMVVAAFCLLAWGMLPDGPARSICFIFSSVTIVSTLLVNLNPAMRFDGYYIFSDLFALDNLQQTGFAYTRGTIYRTLLGIPYQPVATYSLRQKVFMLFYAVNTWIYRVGLYLGIAILVYYKFTKLLGIVLFLTEIIFFLLKPAWRQVKMVWLMRSKISFSLRSVLTLLLLVGLVSWVALPWPRTLHLPAITELAQSQLFYAPVSGRLIDLHAARNQAIRHGDTLCAVESLPLLSEIELVKLELKQHRLEINQLAGSSRGKGALPAKKEELIRSEFKLKRLQEKLQQGTLKSELDGILHQWDNRLQEGSYVKKGQLLGKAGNPDSLIVKAYLKEADVARLPQDGTCVFIDQSNVQRLPGRIVSRSPLRARTIPYRALTSVAKGEIAVLPYRGQLEALESYYEVDVALDSCPPHLRLNQIGRLEIQSRPRSLIRSLLDAMHRIFIRESWF
jgi:putative peptide zinc metalloprotease protein